MILRLAWAIFWLLPAAAQTVLVLPFANASNQSNLDWIGESISESLSNALAAHGVAVIDADERREALRRLSLRPYSRLTRASAIKLGEAVDADLVIHGIFELTSNPQAPSSRGSLRIQANLLDLRRFRRTAEYMELGALEDLARLQNHLAWQTLQFVTPEAAPSEEEYNRTYPPYRVDAIESYIRGLLAQQPEHKLKWFSQAVKLEPNFGQAQFALGKLHWEQKNWRAGAEALARVPPASAKYHEAQFLLGLCRLHLGDALGAEETYKRLAEVLPLNEVFNNLGVAQLRRGSPLALASFQRALEGDPRDPDYHFNTALAHFRRGEYQEAAAGFRAVLERNSTDAEAMAMLGRSLQATKSRPEGGTLPSERLKNTFEDTAYRQLKSILERRKQEQLTR
jgi:tetratricopeptide (TPR) repeat protein